jgi:predicted transcriptional regulator
MRAQLREPLHEGIPQAIVEANVIHGVSMIRAWREHLGLTQAEVAARANMKQPALARLERGGRKAAQNNPGQTG